MKGEVRLFASFTAAEAASPTLLKWNYPQMGQTGTPYRTYTAATVGVGGPAFPLVAASGSEGVFSVARTATGLWTITLQDAYQRLIDLHGFISVAGGAPNIVAIHENTSITAMNSGTPPRSIIGVAFLSATAALADPTVAARVNLCFTLQNNTEP